MWRVADTVDGAPVLKYDPVTMNDEFDPLLNDDSEEVTPVRTVAMPRIPEKLMPPITNRFLFVDVAAQRAKQLRRGALPRLEQLRPDPDTGELPPSPNRMEWIAMEEVGKGLVTYEVSGDKPEAES